MFAYKFAEMQPVKKFLDRIYDKLYFIMQLKNHCASSLQVQLPHKLSMHYAKTDSNFFMARTAVKILHRWLKLLC